MALWISHLSWLSMGNKLDASLQAKKSNEEAAEVKAAVAEVEEKIDDVKGDIEKAIDDVKQDATRVKDTLQAAVPAIRVSDTCTVKVCGKDNGYHIPHYESPDWYDLYMRAFIRVHLRDHDNTAKYEEVPSWKNVEYCITIRQQNDKTHVTSFWEKLPASRFYLAIVGYVQYDEDDEEDQEISENKDACNGDVVMTWKYLIEMFQSGDDFTKLPTERTNVDDAPYSKEGSIVHYRKGKNKFTGKLLEHMSRWRARKAFWVVDGTLLEAAADVPSGHITDDGILYTPDSISLGVTDFGMDRFFWYSSSAFEGAKVQEVSNRNSFWDVMSSDDYAAFKNQKKALFDGDISDAKDGAQFITDFAVHYAAANPPPITYTKGKANIAITPPTAVACPTVDKCHNKAAYCKSNENMDCCLTQCSPPDPAASGGGQTKFQVTLGNLFDKVRYGDYNKKLAIVECGLFPKTLPKPKNCDVKSESEAVR